MKVRHYINNNRATDEFLKYIGILMNKEFDEFFKKDQNFFLNAYKHLKNCRVCNDFYTAFKRAALAKDYDDYVMKFESDCPKNFDKESFDNIKIFFLMINWDY